MTSRLNETMKMALESNEARKMLQIHSCSWPEFSESSMCNGSSYKSISQPVKINTIELLKINATQNNIKPIKTDMQNICARHKTRIIFNSECNASKRKNSDSNYNIHVDDKYLDMNQVVSDVHSKEVKIIENDLSNVINPGLHASNKSNSDRNYEENQYSTSALAVVPVTSASISNKYLLQVDMIQIIHDIIYNFPYNNDDTKHADLNINEFNVSSKIVCPEENSVFNEINLFSISSTMSNDITDMPYRKQPLSLMKQITLNDTEACNDLGIGNILEDAHTELLTNKLNNITNPIINSNETINEKPKDTQHNFMESNLPPMDNTVNVCNKLNTKLVDSIPNTSDTQYRSMNTNNGMQQSQERKDMKLRKDAIVQTDICNILKNEFSLCNCIKYNSIYKESSSMDVEDMSLEEIESKLVRKRNIQALYLEFPSSNKRAKPVSLFKIPNNKGNVLNNRAKLTEHSNNGYVEKEIILMTDKVEGKRTSYDTFEIQQDLSNNDKEKSMLIKDQEVPVVKYERKNNKILHRGCRNFYWNVQHDATNQEGGIDKRPNLNPQLRKLPKQSRRVGLSRLVKPKKLHFS